MQYTRTILRLYKWNPLLFNRQSTGGDSLEDQGSVEGKEYINAWLKTHPEYETDDDEMFYDEDEEENEDELWDAKLTAHHCFYNQAREALHKSARADGSRFCLSRKF